MFGFIKNQLKKIYNSVTSHVASLFNRRTIDESTLQELETILISADTGVKTTKKIIEQLKTDWQSGSIQEGQHLKTALNKKLHALLEHATKDQPATSANVFVLVGINGSGKTTFAGKLTHVQKNLGKRVLLVAADTFRAAATEQLAQWAHKSDVAIVTGQQGQDPAAVVFQGCERFKQEQYDVLIIDTAGRLQTKINLMKELEKIKKIITRQLPEHAVCTLLTIDSMLGQNSFEQARLFNESTDLQGIVLTKMDGTGKGGIVFAIAQELNIPIAYISYGEQMDALKSFDADEYINDLLGA